MDIKSSIIGLVALVGVVLGGIALLPKADAPQSPQLGSLAGPNIPYQFLNWGGVPIFNFGITVKQATSTVCAIQSPAATSTLIAGSIRMDVSSSSALIIEMAKATTAFATTTLIGTKFTTAAAAQVYLNASTSPQAGDANVFGPNQWFNIKVAGGITGGDSAGTGFVPTGTCQAVFVASQSL